MTFSKLLDEIVARGEPLSKHTSFAIGGPAEYFARPRSVAELRMLLDWAGGRRLEWRVLGLGTNVLVADEGVSGLVVLLESEAFRGERVEAGCIELGASWRLSRLVAVAGRAGLSGAEALIGIPGTVGGAVMVNAGGRHGCVGDICRYVRVMDPDGSEKRLGRDELRFDYRRSNLGASTVLEVGFGLVPSDRRSVEAEQRRIYERKLLAQPLWEKSAGCIFKNPAGRSAGELIDGLGLKGLSCGDARVSPRHANFIVSDGRASAGDVLALVEEVRRRVREASGVELDLEIDVWRDQG